MNESGWSVLDGQVDKAPKALRAKTPDPASETQALTNLLAAPGQ